MVHELKLLSEFYEKSLCGLKNFEIRRNDRDYQVGDTLVLKEWNRGKYTGRQHYKLVTYILDDEDYLKDGYVCLGVVPIAEPIKQNTQFNFVQNGVGGIQIGQNNGTVNRQERYGTRKMSDKVTSHSEKNILKGCIGLMSEVYQQMINYLDFIGVDLTEQPEEEVPDFSFSYFEIVQKLFLWQTTHSGGTSTIEKCNELGVDSSKNVEFNHNEYEPDWY